MIKTFVRLGTERDFSLIRSIYKNPIANIMLTLYFMVSPPTTLPRGTTSPGSSNMTRCTDWEERNETLSTNVMIISVDDPPSLPQTLHQTLLNTRYSLEPFRSHLNPDCSADTLVPLCPLLTLFYLLRPFRARRVGLPPALPSTSLDPHARSSSYILFPTPLLSCPNPRALAEGALRMHCGSLYNPLALTCCPPNPARSLSVRYRSCSARGTFSERVGKHRQSGGWKFTNVQSSKPQSSSSEVCPHGSFRDPSQTERPTGVTSLVIHLINLPSLPDMFLQLPGLTSKLNYLHPTPCLRTCLWANLAQGKA